jgi:hypothetical protein
MIKSFKYAIYIQLQPQLLTTTWIKERQELACPIQIFQELSSYIDY